MAHIKKFTVTYVTRALCTLAALCLLSACAGPKKEVMKTVFFPPLPDEPHIQFLTAINDSSFLEDTSIFKSIVSGMEKPTVQVRLLKPYGIALYKGVIYVCDTVPNTVYRIDIKNRKFESLKGNSGSGGLKKPVNLVIDENGILYVVDSLKKEVMIYSAEGEFLRSVGRGVLNKPVAVAVDKETLYVLDFGDNVVKLLDLKTGSFIRQIGNTAEVGLNLMLPVGLARDAQGYLYTTSTGTGKMVKLDVDGHVILSFGKIGDFLGEFTRPKGITVDDQGRIYIVDAGNQNVQIFDDKKTLLMPFGLPGLPHGSLNLPAGVTVTKDYPDYFKQFVDPNFEVDHLIFVTNQSGREMISVYGIGRYTGEFKKPTELQKAPEKPATDKPADQVKPADQNQPADQVKPAVPDTSGGKSGQEVDADGTKAPK